MYLRSFEYFRALAIVLIVLGHCYGISGWTLETFGDRFLANLISGGTSLFVFISGFLFHHVFYPRFQYKKFLTKKIKNVYIPYLILSVIPVIYALYFRIPFPEFYFGSEDTFFDQILRPVVLYYWYGGVMTYWYIPFIMTMFILSPIFIYFINLKTRTQIHMLFFLFIVAMIVHRPVNNWSVAQSVVFFSPMYMLGILCSIEREWIYRKLDGKEMYLLGIVLFLAAAQAFFFESCGNMQKKPFEFNWIDISYAQKAIMSIWLMLFLRRYEDVEIPLLKKLASASFSIYFLHGWFIYLISSFQDLYKKIHGVHLLPLLSTCVIYASYNIALYIRKKIPENSRMLIGW